MFILLEDYLCTNLRQRSLVGNEVVDLPLILIGFSRGALVLNQLLSEFGTSLYSDSVLLRCREIHWLDCGNGANHLCFPVLSEAALDSLRLYRFGLVFVSHAATRFVFVSTRLPISTRSLRRARATRSSVRSPSSCSRADWRCGCTSIAKSSSVLRAPR